LFVGQDSAQPPPTTGNAAIDGVIARRGQTGRINGLVWVTNSLFLNGLIATNANSAYQPPHFSHDTFLKGSSSLNEGIVNATGIDLYQCIYDGAFSPVHGADNFDVSQPKDRPSSFHTPAQINRNDGTEYPDSQSIDINHSPPGSPPPIPAPEPYDVYGHTRTLGDGTDAGAAEYVPIPPGATASGLGADSITTSSARIFGAVDPRGAPTSVSEAHGAVNSSPVADLAMNAGPTRVTRSLSGLLPGTFYKFRFLMHNVNGHTTSATASFATAATSTPRTVSTTLTQATIPLVCRLKKTCKGTVKLSLIAAQPRSAHSAPRPRLTLAAHSYSIKPRHTLKLKLKMTSKGRKALKHKKSLAVLITLREKAANGHIITTLHTATLRVHAH
jgi:hypothetical protein